MKNYVPIIANLLITAIVVADIKETKPLSWVLTAAFFVPACDGHLCQLCQNFKLWQRAAHEESPSSSTARRSRPPILASSHHRIIAFLYNSKNRTFAPAKPSRPCPTPCPLNPVPCTLPQRGTTTPPSPSGSPLTRCPISTLRPLRTPIAPTIR